MSKQDVEHKVNYYDDGTIRCEEWHLDGKVHRVDGPAYIGYNKDGTVAYEEWRLHGEEYSKEEFTKSYQHQMYLANIEVDKMLEDV